MKKRCQFGQKGKKPLKITACTHRRNFLINPFDGEMFVDHAVRNEEGKLVDLTNASEAGQYYALLFGCIDWNESKYAKLKQYIFQGFDGVNNTRDFVEVNAFFAVVMADEI